MEIGFIVSLVVLLVVLYFGFRLLKSLIKTLMMVAVVLIVIIAGAGFLVWSDVKDLRENFSNSTKLILFAGEDRIAFGAEVITLDVKGVKILPHSTLDSWEDDYRDGKYKKIRGDDYYKVFIIRDEKYDEPPDSIDDYVTLIKLVLSEGNVRNLIVKHRKGDFIIYPESAVFKAIKLIPKKWVLKLDRSDTEESDS